VQRGRAIPPRPRGVIEELDAAGTSNSTNVRLTTRQKSTLFQWLAVPLCFPTGKDSAPTGSWHSVHNFAVATSLTRSYCERHGIRKGGAHRVTLRGPARARHAPASARAANDREPRSPLRAYWSVYELTHRAPGSRRAVGSRSTARTSVSFGGNSSSYWCQQNSVFAAQDRFRPDATHGDAAFRLPGVQKAIDSLVDAELAPQSAVLRAYAAGLGRTRAPS
jgi:hypothetical protein